jgi:hypothetical protein
MLYGNEYQGALFLTTCDALEDEEPVITDICRLPLESQFLMAGYMELLPLVSEVEYERDVTQIEPVDIRCDTTVCHLRFDIAPAAGEPGILFAFRDARLLPILIEIFRKTSPFGSCDSCLQKIKEVVQEN